MKPQCLFLRNPSENVLVFAFHMEIPAHWIYVVQKAKQNIRIHYFVANSQLLYYNLTGFKIEKYILCQSAMNLEYKYVYE